MKSFWKLALLALFSLSLFGCGSLGTRSDEGAASVEEPSAAQGTGGEAESGYGAETQGLSQGEGLAGSALGGPESPLSQRILYFDFDSASVREADREVLAAHADYLIKHPMSRVTLEGHADERGSREYNIGLGDRRAQAVKRMLEFMGVNPAQISTVSYGEEKPAVAGHDESAWSLNRRVEIVYAGQ